jgi:hypothetical protein
MNWRWMLLFVFCLGFCTVVTLHRAAMALMAGIPQIGPLRRGAAFAMT